MSAAGTPRGALRRAGTWASVPLALFLLCACSDEPSGAAGPSTTAEPDEPSGSAEVSSGETPRGWDDAMWGVLLGNSSTEQDDLVESTLNDTAQRYITECMRALGFEYEPLPTVLNPSAAINDRKFAQDHGFGLVDSALGVLTNSGPEDPNAERVAEMPQPEALAYDDALNGDEGCAVTSMTQARDELGWAELQGSVQAMNDAVQADPRYLDLLDGWSTCAADADWPSESPQGLIDQFSDLVIEALQKGDRDGLERIRSDEVAAATSTFDCRTEYFDGYRPIVEEHAEPLLLDQ